MSRYRLLIQVQELTGEFEGEEMWEQADHEPIIKELPGQTEGRTRTVMSIMDRIIETVNPEDILNSHLCPVCGSEDIQGGRFEMGGDDAWQEVSCEDCGSRWDEVYTFIQRDLKEAAKAAS